MGFFTGYQKLRTRNKMLEIGSGRVRQFLITLKTDCAEKPACRVRSWCQKHDMTEAVCNLKWKTYGIIRISHDLYDKQHGQLNSQKPQTLHIVSSVFGTPWLCLFALRHDLMSRHGWNTSKPVVTFDDWCCAVTKVETFQVRMQPGKCPQFQCGRGICG